MRLFLEGSVGQLHVSVVSDHASAAERAREIVRGAAGPTALFVGGGGGTLRGVIEGIAAASGGHLPTPERLCIAPLRMGSGNLLARALGVPRDPLEACRLFVSALAERRVTRCAIGRYDFEREGGAVETRYAAGLAGFGLLGRLSGDLERWHARFPRVRRWLGPLLGIERWNDMEYAIAAMLRACRAAVEPRSLEEVEVGRDGERKTLRALAGAVLSFPVPALPFDAGTRVDEERLTLHLVPYRGRVQALSLVLAARRHARSAMRFEIEPGRALELRLRDRDEVEVFLDEDPIRLQRRLRVSVAGTLAFLGAREG